MTLIAKYFGNLGPLLLLSSLLASQAHADIRGLYGSECLEMKDLSATKDLLFDADENRFEIVQTVYADKTCSLPVYDFSFSGPYSYEKDSGHLEYKFQSIQLRVLNASIAEAFMDTALCGVKEWHVDVAQEVTGLTCAGTRMPAAGLQLFDIAKEDGDGVQLGLATDERDGLDEDKRPNSFDANIYAAR